MTCIATGAMAQAGKPAFEVDHYPAAQWKPMAQKLEQQESFRTRGVASETLANYPGHSTALTVRSASGGAEVHAHFSDIFFVLSGEATLLTGRTVLHPQEIAPGETRGDSLQDAQSRLLTTGDVVHISPKVPHQLILAPGQVFTYFVVKVKDPAVESTKEK